MNVRQFLQWVRTASAGDRAEAASALARAYLHSELSADDLAAAEGAMIMLLDDPSPLVRRTLSEVFASSHKAPSIVVHALAAEQPEIAAPVLLRSPLLPDADLVDLVATSHPEAQSAIASRSRLSRSVSAAIAEVGAAQACLALLENADAEITTASTNRIIERFGHLAPIRENLLMRDDLPAAARQTLLIKLSLTLAGFVASRHWLGEEHAHQAALEACEKATVALAAETPYHEIGDLVRHLRESGQLTTAVILRALLCGNVALFEEALAELSDLPIGHVVSYVHDKNISGFYALYRRAGLPDAAYPAFREAVTAMREDALAGEQGGAGRLKRRITERVLARCVDGNHSGIEPVLILLRRFAVEAAREEARMFCDDLVSTGSLAADSFVADDVAAGPIDGGNITSDDIAFADNIAIHTFDNITTGDVAAVDDAAVFAIGNFTDGDVTADEVPADSSIGDDIAADNFDGDALRLVA